VILLQRAAAETVVIGIAWYWPSPRSRSGAWCGQAAHAANTIVLSGRIEGDDSAFGRGTGRLLESKCGKAIR